MYIERAIDQTLIEWKNSKKRKPLLLRGVRQCGKTSAVRHFGEHFENYVEINLEKQNQAHAAFAGDLEPKRILQRLELETGQVITAGNTLLFLDEIQNCPKAITALRYFYEELPDLHVIAAGSLLEIVLNRKKNKIDFPVGRVRSIYMYPFSFREYLQGTGKERLRSYLDKLQVFEEANDAHNALLEEYKKFLLVGGMPEAVSEFAESESLLSCQQIHRDIEQNFKDDIEKYDTDIPADIIRRVFEFTIHNVCNQVKASSAIEGVSAYYFNECIELLNRAGLVYPVKATSCETLPMEAGAKAANKKLLFFDSGIYLTNSGLNLSGLLASQAFTSMNKGSVVEMQTGLEIIKQGDPYKRGSIYYWYKSGSNAEVDYVIQQGTQIVPIEVKASGSGSMQSLHRYLQLHPSVPYGIRISLEDFTEYQNIRVYPVYGVNHLMANKSEG